MADNLKHIVSVDTLADLKTIKGTNNIVINIGKNTMGDGLGALYFWDAANVEAEDTIYNNIVKATGVTTGRWKKVFQRMQNLPHGVLVINSGKKEFFCSTTVNASSEATINLTMDNTVNGTPIFTEIWFDDSKATVNTTTSNDAVTSFKKSLSVNLKQLTHGFFRGNSTLLNLSIITTGLTVGGFRSVPQGTPVQFKIEGI